MTDIPSTLELYREQLLGAIDNQLEYQRRARARRRRVLRVAVPTAAAVAAGGLALSFTGGSSVSSADAAILHHVAAALTGPPDSILHERAIVTAPWGTAPYELWVENSPPYAYRVTKWHHHGTGTAGAPDDWAAELRSLVQSGGATVAGTATIDGTAAYKLTVTGSSDRFLNGTAYVSQSDYYPLVVDTGADGGEHIVFQTYQYLPATAANLRLFAGAHAVPHSGARVRRAVHYSKAKTRRAARYASAKTR
jgi:hypothetical protein